MTPARPAAPATQTTCCRGWYTCTAIGVTRCVSVSALLDGIWSATCGTWGSSPGSCAVVLPAVYGWTEPGSEAGPVRPVDPVRVVVVTVLALLFVAGGGDIDLGFGRGGIHLRVRVRGR